MSLTKDKLITRLQVQVGLDKQESRQIVERLLENNEGHLSPGRRVTH
jgi:nucleoid DNA-binding protein